MKTAVAGEFVIIVGEQRFQLKPGDSVIAPRQISHVWAHVGDNIGRMLITFSPAGQMEAFFQEVNKANAMPPQTPELWSSHGMQLLGAPLLV
jgi:quercetin dioxygenase-like cupin family protein